MLSREEIESAKETKMSAYDKCKELQKEIVLLEDDLKEKKKEWTRYKELYELADKVLAEHDGRLKRVALGAKGHKVEITLTKEQVAEIATKLGVEIKFEEEDK